MVCHEAGRRGGVAGSPAGLNWPFGPALFTVASGRPCYTGLGT